MIQQTVGYAGLRSCPTCGIPLAPQRAGEIEVDVCVRCNGVFFDPGESAMALGPGADPEQWRLNAGVTPPYPGAPGCPQGHGPMWRLPTSPHQGAPAAHACGECRGAWIDGNTLAAMRSAPPAPPMAAESGAVSVGRYLFQLVSTLPIEVSNPVHRRPWLTWSLAASMLAAFIALRVIAPQDRRDLEAMLAVIPAEYRAGFGQLTPLTCVWLHIDWLHLVGNLYFLLIFGDNIEDRFGKLKYMLLLASATWVGALCEVATRGQSVVGVGGASGAIAGVLGAYMVLFPRTKLHVVLAFIPLKIPAVAYFVVWLILQVVGYLAHRPGVAWLAHVGGFVIGVIAAATIPSTAKGASV